MELAPAQLSGRTASSDGRGPSVLEAFRKTVKLQVGPVLDNEVDMRPCVHARARKRCQLRVSRGAPCSDTPGLSSRRAARAKGSIHEPHA